MVEGDDGVDEDDDGEDDIDDEQTTGNDASFEFPLPEGWISSRTVCRGQKCTPLFCLADGARKIPCFLPE